MLTNIYCDVRRDDDVPKRTAAALLAACRSMPHLWQLDLSGHGQVFYGCIEPKGIVEVVRASPSLRRLDLSQNSKYDWRVLRGDHRSFEGIRDVFNQRGADAPPCTVRYGDGVEVTTTAPVAGESNELERLHAD